MKLQDILLLEATFNTNELVDYFYNEVYKDYFDNLLDWSEKPDKKIKPLKIKTKKYKAKKLLKVIRDPVIRKALEENPDTKFIIGLFSSGSYYNILRNEVVVTPDYDLYFEINDALKDEIPFTKYLMSIGNDRSKLQDLNNFINGNDAKNSLSHEISHWMDDTLNNKHLSKTVKKARLASIKNPYSDKYKKIIKRGQPDDYMTDYEINAVIHSIRELKRKYTQEDWDRLTFRDLLFNNVPLSIIFERYKTWKMTPQEEQKLKQFYKRFFKRMDRENLLGKNMRKDISEYTR